MQEEILEKRLQLLEGLLEDLQALEPLEKGTCVRCSNSTSGGPGARCSSCLSKLRSKRKTPGTKERAAQHADQALRRQRAGKGTTSKKKSKGLGNRQDIQRKMQNAEKKHGEKLSANRRDNGKGYASSNVEPVKQDLNRGTHEINKKKLAAWKKKKKD